VSFLDPNPPFELSETGFPFTVHAVEGTITELGIIHVVFQANFINPLIYAPEDPIPPEIPPNQSYFAFSIIIQVGSEWVPLGSPQFPPVEVNVGGGGGNAQVSVIADASQLPVGEGALLGVAVYGGGDLVSAGTENMNPPLGNCFILELNPTGVPEWQPQSTSVGSIKQLYDDEGGTRTATRGLAPLIVLVNMDWMRRRKGVRLIKLPLKRG
jgi:hypothetical protein